MVWSSNCSTVAPMAHAVIIPLWGTSWWRISPDIFAALSSSATWTGRMRITGSHRQTRRRPLVLRHRTPERLARAHRVEQRPVALLDDMALGERRAQLEAERFHD